MLEILGWNISFPFLLTVKEGGEDNRALKDDGLSQKLTPEEIIELKHKGLSGKEVWVSLLFCYSGGKVIVLYCMFMMLPF